jgi:hypothetical protein
MVQGRGPFGSVYKQLSDGQDGGKRGLITSAISRTRNMAQIEILNEHGPHQGE